MEAGANWARSAAGHTFRHSKEVVFLQLPAARDKEAAIPSTKNIRMKKPPITLKPAQNFAGAIQFFKWPKGVKKIVCEGYTITRLGTVKKKRKAKP